MKNLKWLNLQFFAGEGAASGGDGGEGGNPGVNAAAPEQDNALERLGVPKEKAEKYRARRSKATPPVKAQEPETAAGTVSEGQTPAAEAKEETPARKTLRELIHEDESLNGELQEIVKDRLKKFEQDANRNKERLESLMPALALIAKKHGFDASDMDKLDFKALNEAVTDDDSYWEETAEEYGVSVDGAKKIKGYEEMQAQQAQRERDELRMQQLRRHLDGLIQQSNELKKVYPSFDLQTELQNPAFARMTSPEGGMSVEQAFHALHYKELKQAEAAVIAKRTQEAMANSIAAGQSRPTETGRAQSASSGQPVQIMSKAERDALKQRIYSGEKIYPGR